MDKKKCGGNVAAKRLYSIKELTAEIGGTVWFWREQIWNRRLPYIQVGRKMFIDNKDVEAFIAHHKVLA